MTCKILEIANFASEIISMHSGHEALDYIQKIIANGPELPNWIFLDMNMPIVDGAMFLNKFETFGHAITRSKLVILTNFENEYYGDTITSNKHVIGSFTKPLTQELLASISLKSLR